MERKSQTGIKYRDRSEGQRRLFRRQEERLFAALHECGGIQPPETAFKLTKDLAACVCVSETGQALQDLKIVFKSSCSCYSLVFVIEDVNLKGTRRHQSWVGVWR